MSVNPGPSVQTDLPGATAARVVVELVDADIGHGEAVVLPGVSLRIDRGEQVALTGPNGSGKTSLVRTLLGLAPVLGGEVRLFGRPVDRLTERWRIGYVPQRQSVGGAVPATVSEVVASGRLARRGTWHWAGRAERAEDRAAVAEAIATVGLADRADARVAILSGGQQRRVLIARALASSPEVMVMDEPTAGVDAESQQRLVTTLAQLADRGLTLLVVTHELEPLRRLLTRTVRLHEGHLDSGAPGSTGSTGHHGRVG